MSKEGHRELEIGRILRRTRAEKGLSLEEVQEATRIRVRYLEALENEDYDVLPAPVYVRGFLKTYANYLGLDGDELAEEVKKQQAPSPEERRIYYEPPGEEDFDEADPEPGALAPLGLGQALSRFAPAITLAVLAVAVLVGILYFIGRGSQPVSDEAGSSPPPAKHEEAKPDKPAGGEEPAGENPPPEETTTASPEPNREEKEPPAEEPPEPESIEAVVSVKDGISWLEIRADGETVFAQVARPGFSQTFKAQQELSITTGNAGAVEVEVNGQKVGVLGASGEVLTRRFTLKTETPDA